MTDTALSAANASGRGRAHRDPGQALAYVGELKIRELRARAQSALGEVRLGGSDAVLGQGAVPLDTLEAQIDS
jgi:uncharacterized protein (DUF885 family)